MDFVNRHSCFPIRRTRRNQFCNPLAFHQAPRSKLGLVQYFHKILLVLNENNTHRHPRPILCVRCRHSNQLNHQDRDDGNHRRVGIVSVGVLKCAFVPKPRRPLIFAQSIERKSVFVSGCFTSCQRECFPFIV